MDGKVLLWNSLPSCNMQYNMQCHGLHYWPLIQSSPSPTSSLLLPRHSTLNTQLTRIRISHRIPRHVGRQSVHRLGPGTTSPSLYLGLGFLALLILWNIIHHNTTQHQYQLYHYSLQSVESGKDNNNKFQIMKWRSIFAIRNSQCYSIAAAGGTRDGSTEIRNFPFTCTRLSFASLLDCWLELQLFLTIGHNMKYQYNFEKLTVDQPLLRSCQSCVEMPRLYTQWYMVLLTFVWKDVFLKFWNGTWEILMGKKL
jgi:hypothetical protein